MQPGEKLTLVLGVHLESPGPASLEHMDLNENDPSPAVFWSAARVSLVPPDRSRL